MCLWYTGAYNTSGERKHASTRHFIVQGGLWRTNKMQSKESGAQEMVRREQMTGLQGGWGGLEGRPEKVTGKEWFGWIWEYNKGVSVQDIRRLCKYVWAVSVCEARYKGPLAGMSKVCLEAGRGPAWLRWSVRLGERWSWMNNPGDPGVIQVENFILL